MNKTKNVTLGIIIALSIAMVGATVVLAIPSQAEAFWCFTFNDCFNGKGQCEKSNTGATPCEKIDKRK